MAKKELKILMRKRENTLDMIQGELNMCVLTEIYIIGQHQNTTGPD